jgi:hypothetical protein
MPENRIQRQQHFFENIKKNSEQSLAARDAALKRQK